jgi:hypothetical protein
MLVSFVSDLTGCPGIYPRKGRELLRWRLADLGIKPAVSGPTFLYFSTEPKRFERNEYRYSSRLTRRSMSGKSDPISALFAVNSRTGSGGVPWCWAAASESRSIMMPAAMDPKVCSGPAIG